MKNNFTKLFLITILPISFFSCNNDDSNSDNLPESSNISKVVTYLKLTNVYEFDSNGNPIREIEEGNFIYDSDFKKLLALESISGNTMTKFHYNNDEITSIEYVNNGVQTSLVNLYYNNQKLNYTLTNEDNEVTERHDYIYDNSGKLIQENICSNEEQCNGSNYKKYFHQNNNITKILDKSFNWIPFPTNESIYEYTFVNSKNPFINMQPVLRILYNDFFNSLNDNNINVLKSYRNNESTPDHTITYSYSYDRDYYPLVVIGKDQLNREVMKIEYRYNQ